MRWYPRGCTWWCRCQVVALGPFRSISSCRKVDSPLCPILSCTRCSMSAGPGRHAQATAGARQVCASCSWGRPGVCKALQEGMDVVFSQLSQQEGAAALLQRCDKPIQLLYSYLHPASQSLSAQQTKQYIPFGRMRVKCLLEKGFMCH